MKVLIVSILLLVLHLGWGINRVVDLFTKSQRKNKIQWLILILLVPFVGSLVYNLTMRRQKPSRRTIIF